MSFFCAKCQGSLPALLGILGLAPASSNASITAGSVLTQETSPPCILVVLLREFGMPTSGGAPTVAHAVPGDVGAMYELLGDAPEVRLAASQPSSVFKIDREDLFDLLGQRPDLLQQIFAVIFGRAI